MKSKGFTLIELIVTIAIIGICVFLVSLSVSTIFSSEAKKCAYDIDALLSQTKLSAMSKEDGVYLWLTCTDSGDIVANYYEKNGLVSQDTIGGTRCSVFYTVNGHDTKLDATGIYISFHRDTGAFDFSRNGWESGAVCSGITVVGGSRTYALTLVSSTGAHKLEG